MRAVGMIGAGVVAVLVHLAAFAAVAPHLRGANAAGDGGAAAVTLTAADPALAALVADWDRPPEIMAAAPEPTAPPVPPVAPSGPDLPSAADRVPAMAPPGPAPMPPHAAEAAPRRDLATPVPKPARADPPLKADPPAKKMARAKPQPAPQADVPAQQAAGVGGQGAAGQSGAAADAQSGSGAAAQAQWGAAIRARIERRKAYPSDAGGAVGKVTLRLVVAADGRLASVAVARSSGVAALDRAALRAVKAAGRFPKAPKGTGGASFSLPVSFAP